MKLRFSLLLLSLLLGGCTHQPLKAPCACDRVPLNESLS